MVEVTCKNTTRVVKIIDVRKSQAHCLDFELVNRYAYEKFKNRMATEISLPGLGLSLVDDKPQELFFLVAHGI